MDDNEEAPTQVMAGNVAVYCRFRPFNPKEIAMGEDKAVSCAFVDDKTIEVDVRTSML